MKRGIIDLSLEGILGIVLGLIIILGLAYGITNLFKILDTKQPESNLQDIELKANEVLTKDKLEIFTLSLVKDKIFFGIGKNTEILDLSYASTKIKRPIECRSGFSCICECISGVNKDELFCKEEIKCVRIPKAEEIIEIVNYQDSSGLAKEEILKFFRFLKENKEIELELTKRTIDSKTVLIIKEKNQI